MAGKKAILTDAKILTELQIPVLNEDHVTGVAYAEVTPLQEIQIQELAHDWHRCGGYEVIDQPARSTSTFESLVGPMRQQALLARRSRPFTQLVLEKSERTAAAVGLVDENNIRQTVEWFSSYPDRYNKGATANKAVEELKGKLEGILQTSPSTQEWAKTAVTIELVGHVRTPQKSIRARITGTDRPNEIVALGGHLDSISFSGKAPGADDNASGSANLVEAFRILVSQDRAPARSVEIFWYAGEESGLLGSAEIAADYKKNAKNVIGVLQLDMTLHAGSGELVFASMTDFTNPTLRGYLAEMNRLYVGGRVVDDKCGYGCSDHASWHRQGFATVMPFEASFDDMNHDIHTPRDTINAQSNFKHSAAFSKLALAFAMDLADSDWKP